MCGTANYRPRGPRRVNRVRDGRADDGPRPVSSQTGPTFSKTEVCEGGGVIVPSPLRLALYRRAARILQFQPIR